MLELENYLEAASTLSVNIINSPIEGKFRKISLAALDYVHKLDKGAALSFDQKRTIGIILTLGKSINDFYDMGYLDSDKYRNLRREFKHLIPEKNEDFCRYWEDLARVEKSRPKPTQLIQVGEPRLAKIQNYRESVNRLYLAFAYSVALDRSMSMYFEDYSSLSENDKCLFEGFFNSVMAMQVVDDLVGCEGDIKADRPSFYTAVCTPYEIKNKVVKRNKDTFRKLDNIFSNYYDSANRCFSKPLRPILTAVKITKSIYPRLTQLVRKLHFLTNLPNLDVLSKRDRDNL